ncbi:MAG: co-chaperone GroES, partial [Phycisphaerae bacterium]
RSEMQVKKNDEVLFTSYAGTEIKVGDQELMIMDEGDILGIVE